MNISTDRLEPQIEFVRQAEEISESLWTECFGAPREGRFWYRALEACGLEDQFSFHYALIRLEGIPVGIAPCFLHDVPISLVAPPAVAWFLSLLSRVFPRAGRQRTFFVGSPCSDEGTIGLIGGVSLAEVIGGLRGAIRARARELGAHMIVCKDFPETDLAALTGGGDFFPTVSYPGTSLALQPDGKDAYLRGLSHNRRHNFQKKLCRSRNLLALETTVVARPSDREVAEIFGLFLQTYERGRTKFERLDIRFFMEIREHEPARFILLRDPATGGLAAFMLVFCLGNRVINKFIGLEYRRAEETFLYFRLFDAALDFACRRGAKELQSGQTGYRAKLGLGHGLVPLFNVFRHEQPIINAVFRAIGRRVTWRSLDRDLATHLDAHQTSRAR